MAFANHIDTELNCVYIRYFGEFTNGEGLVATQALINEPDYQRGMHIIKDYSDVNPIEKYDYEFASRHVHRLVDFDEELGPCKIALLAADTARFGLLRQVALLSEGSKAVREAFTSLDDVADWLGISPERLSAARPLGTG